MKLKIVLSALIATLIINSCNRETDEATESVNKKILLSKVTTRKFDGSSQYNSVTTFTYDSKNNLIKSDTDGNTVIYEYNGSGLLSKTLHYRFDGSLNHEKLYTYKGNNIDKIKYSYTSSNGYYDNASLLYDTTGNIKSVNFCRDKSCSNSDIFTYTFAEENVKNVTAYFTESTLEKQINDFEYDNTKNPHILLSKQIRVLLGTANSLSNNNFKTEKETKYYYSTAYAIMVDYKTELNSDGFPIQVSGKYRSDEKPYITYKYEYITN